MLSLTSLFVLSISSLVGSIFVVEPVSSDEPADTSEMGPPSIDPSTEGGGHR